jgi:hypothetical protein
MRIITVNNEISLFTMRYALFTPLLLMSLMAQSQYWIGPKAGFHYTTHVFQDDDYKGMYRVRPDYNFELGMAVTYTASERYAVHGELYFERMAMDLRNREGNYYVSSQSSYSYLSAPFLFRMTLGYAPVHYYVNAGPKISLLVKGSGSINSSDLEEFEGGRKDYKLTLNEDKANGHDVFWIRDGNRFLYSLTAGGGFYLDLQSGARLMFDFRYNWGHSNIGFNGKSNQPNPKMLEYGRVTDGEAPVDTYRENYEYTNNTISASIAYQFHFDRQLRRQGSSTSKESRETRKKARSKK